MRPVEDALLPRIVEVGPHSGSILALLQALTSYFVQVRQRLNAVMPMDGSEPMTGPLTLAFYTVATRPAASDWEGSIIYVSDAAAGARYQGSNGSSWVNLG